MPSIESQVEAVPSVKDSRTQSCKIKWGIDQACDLVRRRSKAPPRESVEKELAWVGADNTS